MAKGLQAYAKANPEKATFVEAIWTEVQPADLTLQVRRLANAGTDVIVIQTNTAQAVATKPAPFCCGAPNRVSKHSSQSRLRDFLHDAASGLGSRRGVAEEGHARHSGALIVFEDVRCC